MATTLKLTKSQEDKLYLLRLDGLRREIEWHEAEEAYKKAVEIEKAVSQYVIDNGEYYTDMALRPGNGKEKSRITDGTMDYMMDEEIFANDFLPKVKTAFMELYGIDNPLNFVYSSPMLERKIKAEKSYHMIAVDFLKISGRATEAGQLEKAIKGYLRPKLKEQLMAINNSFINSK